MGLLCLLFLVLFFKKMTAYDMRISDWSSDVCSSDLRDAGAGEGGTKPRRFAHLHELLGPVAVRDRAEVPVGCALEGLVLAHAAVETAFDKRPIGDRSEERRVGNECVSTCSYRGRPLN